MDLLAKRYASPFLVLDEFIRLQQLHDFVIEISQTIAEENEQKFQWEYYLHKVWADISFEDYVQACEMAQKQAQNKELSYQQIGNVINESKMMLEGFVPE